MAYSGMTPGWHCIISTSDDTFQSLTFNKTAETEVKVNNLAINMTTSSIVQEVELANQTFKVCSINGTKCDIFKFIGSFRTIVTEWNLVCDKAWIKQIIISIQMVGLLCGSLVTGQLGNHFGRKNIFYGSLLASSILEFITGFSVSWEMFAVCTFLVGNFMGLFIVIIFPYLLELYPTSWRPIIAGFPMFAIGMCIFAGAAYVLDDWSSLHFVNAALCVPFLLGWFYFPESPRWLAVHDKLDMAQKALERIARCNKKLLPAGTVALITEIAREEKDLRQTSRMYNIVDIFSSFQMAKVTLAMAYISFSIGTIWTGISYGVSALYGNVFLNIFLMAALQIPVQLTSAYVLDKFGRRQSLFLYFLLSILGSVGCLVVIFTAQELSFKGAIITGLCMTVRIAVGIALSISIVWCNELYPTVIRSTGYSFYIISSRLGGVIAPFIVNFDDMAGTSYAIITFLLVTLALLTLIKRETRDMPLLESLL